MSQFIHQPFPDDYHTLTLAHIYDWADYFCLVIASRVFFSRPIVVGFARWGAASNFRGYLGFRAGYCGDPVDMVGCGVAPKYWSQITTKAGNSMLFNVSTRRFPHEWVNLAKLAGCVQLWNGSELIW